MKLKLFTLTVLIFGSINLNANEWLLGDSSQCTSPIIGLTGISCNPGQNLTPSQLTAVKDKGYNTLGATCYGAVTIPAQIYAMKAQ